MLMRKRFILLLAVLASAAASNAAQAQSILPDGSKSETAKAAAAASEAPITSVEDIRKSLAAARAGLEPIEAGGETPPDAPPGTPLTDILERLSLARQLVSAYEKQLNALRRIETAHKRQEEAQHSNESWRGFAEPPPYSILLVDQLRDDLEAAKNSLDSAEATSVMLQRLDASYASKIKASQGAARLAAEAVDRARGTPELPKREWEHRIAALRAEVDSATQTLLQLAWRGAQADVAAATSARNLATRKLAAVGTAVELSRSDLDKVLAEIEQRRRAAERELESATHASAMAAEAASRTEARHSSAGQVPKGGAGKAAAGQKAPEQDDELIAARETAATASQRVFLLRERLLQLDSERAAWESRAVAVNQRDPVRTRAAYDRLMESLAALRATREYLEQQLAAVGGRLRDEEVRQRGTGRADSAAARQLLETLRDRQRDLQAALDGSVPLQRLVARFRADFEVRREVSVMERVKDWLAAARLAGRAVWNFELFAIDDTLEAADGKKVTVSRSVTVGKTFGAAMIVLIGYWLCSLLLRRIERGVVATGRMNAQSAALARKWILFVVAAILTIFALLSASIPLTAFAFLGGALAIAAGFGLQTLLKNLVSGIMLLVERPFRLGDLVEVDEIRGRVTEIGIRASTIRTADGIESMIPNSRFIEGTLTNWTYSSPQARQTLSVGVAYGSPLRKAAEILVGVLGRHEHVLKNPAPQVYLAEFADSAVTFSMTFWIEMTTESDPRRIRSDVLLMIGEALEEAGISIPFPQRDVHLAASQPVPVAIVERAQPRPAG
jgi:potassium efflux system protein